MHMFLSFYILLEFYQWANYWSEWSKNWTRRCYIVKQEILGQNLFRSSVVVMGLEDMNSFACQRTQENRGVIPTWKNPPQKKPENHWPANLHKFHASGEEESPRKPKAVGIEQCQEVFSGRWLILVDPGMTMEDTREVYVVSWASVCVGKKFELSHEFFALFTHHLEVSTFSCYLSMLPE